MIKSIYLRICSMYFLKKWMYILIFIVKGFENWIILIFYFDNLILLNLK